jgi:deoxyribodipyrimidine photo-lyase
MMWHDILDYERQNGANESTYWLRFELLWREFFRWYSREAGSRLFRSEGPSGETVVYQENPAGFLQWCGGQTGVDIVDAAMRELAWTGWLSNRARQLVASYLIYDLNLDWRLGAAWFESQLVDFDVSSNWGNWAYIAGVGPDPRGGRIFNLESQAERYDSDQRYRIRWLNTQ